MHMITLFIMLPVFFWYVYTITDPQHPSRLRSDGREPLSAESIRLPPRRRFPRPRRQRRFADFARPAHPLWDRWVDG
jgi:hypothetical protein